MSRQESIIEKTGSRLDQPMGKRTRSFAITSADVLREAKAQGVTRKKTTVPEAVFLTFNRWIIRALSKTCNLRPWNWPFGKYSPYYTSYQSWKGSVGRRALAVFIPSVGASSIAVFAEDLIYNGAKIIFLLCASWSLGRKCLKKGQIQVPTFAVGLDGTTFHYGNKNFRVEAEPVASKALSVALIKIGAKWKEGGVGACEAFYRITPELAHRFRSMGCLSLENGEVAVLFKLAKVYDIRLGVLLQPYIDLERGWRISYMDKYYRTVCRTQAHAAIEALRQIDNVTKG